MPKISERVLILILLLIAAGSAVIGLSLSFNRVITPGASRAEFLGIARDGWISQGGEIRLDALLPGSKKVLVDLDPWRPRAAGIAIAKVSYCGKELAPFQVQSQNSILTFEISPQCNPPTIHFEFENPFQAPREERLVGVKIRSMTVRYPPQWSVLLTKSFVTCTLLLFAISGLLFLSFGDLWLLRWLPLLAPLFGAYWIGIGLADHTRELLYLWAFLTLLLSGYLFGKRTLRENRLSFSDHSSPRFSFDGLTILLLLIIAIGAAIRFYGIDFGLPAMYHPDEDRKAKIIARMWAEGNFHPGYFLHPSLLLYLTGIMSRILGYFGLGDVNDLSFVRYSGRVVSAVAGTLSIYFVYLIGRLLYSRRAGIWAALFLAAMPLHVTCSRYMKEDALMNCFLLAATAVMLKGVKQNKVYLIYIAAILGGLSASSKYSGVLSILIILCAGWIRSRRFIPDLRMLLHSMAALCFFPIGFFLGSPYALLDFHKFSGGFNAERVHMLTGHHRVIIDAWSQFWVYHFSRSIVPGISCLGAFAACFGIGLLLWRRKIEDLFLIALILMFYLPAEWVKAKPPPQPERYILPCIPFLAILLGELIALLNELRFKVIGLLLGLALIFSIYSRTVLLASEIKHDTRLKMREWMLANIPAGSKILIDAPPYSATFNPNEFNIRNILTLGQRREMNVGFLRANNFNYVLLTSLSYDRYFLTRAADQNVRTNIEEIFSNLALVKEMGPKHGPYGFHNPVLRLYEVK